MSDSVTDPQTAAHQAPPSLGFSRQEHWSGLPFLLQCMKVKSESEVAQLCPTLSDPMDCILPGSSAHGILQARVLEWVAIKSTLQKLCSFTSIYSTKINFALSLLLSLCWMLNSFFKKKIFKWRLFQFFKVFSTFLFFFKCN